MLPTEVSQLLQKLYTTTINCGSTRVKNHNFKFWDETHFAKESFWEKTRYGFLGTEVRWSLKRIIKILNIFVEHISSGLEGLRVSGKSVCPTYFTHRLTHFKEINKGPKKASQTIIFAKNFERHELPPFLEGPVHALKAETNFDRAKQIYDTVRNSELFDRKLGMYRICASLKNESLEIGRLRSFMRGWLENEAIFLHMEYKFLLETLKSGLYEEFYSDLKTCLIPFHDPRVYGRSIFENSSFVVSSVCPDEKMRGRGYAARLSGATSEFIEMWLVMNLGVKPFGLDDRGRVVFRLKPILAPWLFTERDLQRDIYYPSGHKKRLGFRKNTYAFLLLNRTLIVYHNPRRLATYGSRRAVVKRFTFNDENGKAVIQTGDELPHPYAEQLRNGTITRLEVELG